MERMISEGEFLEYAEVHGNLYGEALSASLPSILAIGTGKTHLLVDEDMEIQICFLKNARVEVW